MGLRGYPGALGIMGGGRGLAVRSKGIDHLSQPPMSDWTAARPGRAHPLCCSSYGVSASYADW